MRRVFVLVVALVAVLSCCGTPTSDTEISTAAAPFLTSSSEVDSTAQPTPSTRYIPATTMPTTTSTATSTTMTPTTASDATSELVFLVAGPDGVALHSIDGVESLVPDRRARVAFPDGHGGVVFQGWQGGVWWLPSLDEASIEVVAAGGLRAAGTVDGKPIFLYTVGAQCSEEELFEGACYLAELRLHYLKSSEDALLFDYWAFDGGLISASVGEQTVSASMIGSSDQGVMWFYGTDGAWLEVPHPPIAKPGGEGDCWVGDLSPDGTVLAYSGTAGLCAQPPFVVEILNLNTGEELLRLDLGSGGYPFPGATGVDFDGTRIFVSQWGVPPMLLTLDGRSQEITWLPTWLWRLEEVDSVEDCPFLDAFADGGGQVYCVPPGGAVLWNAG